MLIAQITDLHIGFEPDDPDEYNQQRLWRVLGRIFNGPNRPDLLLLTGDLAEHGDPASYRRLKELMTDCPVPWHVLPGNHDRRTPLSRAFPDIPTPGGFLQYVIDADPLRIIMLDTLDESRHGGGFCDVRAAWLRARLAEAPERPTVLALHHPPMDVGIDWMRTHPAEPWVARLAGAIDGHRQVKAILCGHLHRPIAAQWMGVPVAACPATSPAITLDLRPIDPVRPDRRLLAQADPPGYALHWWNGTDLVSFFDQVQDSAPMLRFDERMQVPVRQMMADRPN